MTATSPPHKVNIILDGKSYVVEIEDLDGAPLHVTVNGVRHLVEIERLEEGAPHTAPKRRPSDGSDAPHSTTAVPVGEIRSPMPGTILDIAVAAGDHVSLGQSICYLEAMKMKNAIHSPRDGVIAAVHVQESQLVAHGDVLVTFE